MCSACLSLDRPHLSLSSSSLDKQLLRRLDVRSRRKPQVVGYGRLRVGQRLCQIRHVGLTRGLQKVRDLGSRVVHADPSLVPKAILLILPGVPWWAVRCGIMRLAGERWW